MTDRSINVKIDGRADLSKLQRQLELTEEKAARLRKELGEARGNLGRLGEAASQLERLSKSGVGNLINLAAGGLAGGAMYSRVSGGLNQYKQHLIMLDEEARTVKRLGESYRDYQRAVVDAGRSYGYGNNEVIGLQSMLARTRGRAGAGQLLPDLRTIQGFGRGYGMGAGEAGSYFNRSIEMGQIGRGGDMANMRQFANLIADAVVTGGMQGREGEVVTSIQKLTGAISSRMVTVQGTRVAGEALATMNATGIRGLQGEQGAALLERLNQAVMQPGGGEAGELFMYRALSGGQPMAYDQFKYLQEEGLGGTTPSGKSNFQALMEATTQTGLKGRYGQMAMGQLTGLSMHQIEALQQTFMPQGKFDTARFGATEKALGPGGVTSVDTSVVPLIAELANGGDVGAVGREFEQLVPGQKAATTREALIEQIKQYGQQNVAMSEGQRREKLDNDIAKASEDAGSGLYGLATAADEATKALLQLGGSIGGPLGGIAPIALGSLGGSALSGAGQWGLKRLFGYGSTALGGAAPGTAATAAGGAPAVAGGSVAAGAPAAAAGGGSALLAGGLKFAGGIGLGVAAAYAGSEIGQRVYGTQAFLGEGHQAAIGKGVANVTEGNTTGQDIYNAAQGMQMAIPGVIGGTAYGAYRSIVNGENFQSAYRTGFFNIDTADSQGRREWLQGQQGSASGGSWSGGGGGGGGGGWGGGGDQQLVERLDALTKGTSLEGKGSLLLALARKYGVPVEVALAQAQREAGAAQPDNNNPFNLAYTGNWGDDRQGSGGYAHFPNADTGIEGYFRMLGGAYQKELAAGMETGDWSSLVGRYAPSSGGDAKQYATQMAAWTQQYHQMLMPSSRGGWWDVGSDDSPALLHKREMVLPASLADDLRAAIRSPGISANEAGAAAGEIRIKIDPIVIQFPDGSRATVQASGQRQPFAGVLDYPTGTVR